MPQSENVTENPLVITMDILFIDFYGYYCQCQLKYFIPLFYTCLVLVLHQGKYLDVYASITFKG